MAVRKPLFLKHFQHPGGLLLLMVGGRRNERQFDLLLDDLLLILLHKGKGFLHIGIFRQSL